MAEIRGWSAEVIGLRELESQFSRIGKFPKKNLTKAAKEGMAGPLADAKASAPTGKTGNLKRSIKRKMETPNKRNKSVYRLIFSEKYTDSFLKDSSGIYGGKPPKAYYPHSVEYGFKTKNGYVRGKYFVTKAIQQNEGSSLQKVVNSLTKSIDDLTK
jgi:hypothetical protein